MKRLLLTGLLLLMLLLSSQWAHACPVCFSPKNEENRSAFVLMTGFLTLLPLGVIGFGVFWYRRRLREFERHQRALRRALRAKERAREPEGRVVTAPAGYFERGHADRSTRR